MNVYLVVSFYIIGAVIGWMLCTTFKKWWNRWKYEKLKAESEKSNKVYDDTQLSFQRDGVYSVYFNGQFATTAETVQMAKWWAAANEGRMTWQQVKAEADKMPNMKGKIEIIFK